MNILHFISFIKRKNYIAPSAVNYNKKNKNIQIYIDKDITNYKFLTISLPPKNLISDHAKKDYLFLDNINIINHDGEKYYLSYTAAIIDREK